MRRVFRLARSHIDPAAHRIANNRTILLVLIAALSLAACGTVDVADQSSGSNPAPNETELAALPPTAIPIARSPTPTPTPTPLPTATSTPTLRVDPAAVDALLDPEDGVYGVVLMSENGDVLYSRNSDAPFITASVYKLIVLADILKRVEQGEIGLDDELVISGDVFPIEGEESDTYFSFDDEGGSHTVRELLYAMGAYSSNICARTLLKLTSPESLTETAQEIGMDQTVILAELADVAYWPPEPSADAFPGDSDEAIAFIEGLAEIDGEVNITTPGDLATYFHGLVDGSTISPYVSEQILSILLQNRIDDRIPYLLEGAYDIANKPGNLEHVTNDAGILFTPDGPRIVIALSEATIWDGRAREAIQRIALLAVGRTDFPPIPEESMEEGYFPDIEWGVPDDPAEIVADPPA